MNKIKVMIVDDHQLVLDGLKSIIISVPEFEVIAEANNGKDAMLKLRHLNVDIILMDIDMPILNGIETTKLVREKRPEIKVLALTMHNEKGIINKMLNSGASGYILKNTYREELILAIKKIISGEKYFSTEVMNTLNEKKSTNVTSANPNVSQIDITEREEEILKLIAEGLSNKEVGEKLNISPRTVDKHRTNLMEKIKVNNIAGLVRYAMQNGYLD